MIEREESLDEEIRRDEERIEEYGADDPEEPPAKSPALKSPSLKSAPAASTPGLHHHKQEHDPNMVRFGGPEDKDNPQNWSRRYKWFVTVICSIMTVNVYVSSTLRDNRSCSTSFRSVLSRRLPLHRRRC